MGDIARISRMVCVVLLAVPWSSMAIADVELPSKFSYRDSVANTRHNMTQRQSAGGGPTGSKMDAYRNDYGEVCVYCHTPHGAHAHINLPLWNRTIKATTYATYAQLGTSSLTQQVVQPGASSLACLSCHDGQVAVDSIINMPGSGGYNPAQATAQNDSFLNAWTNPRGQIAAEHMALEPRNTRGCLSCHSSGAGSAGLGAGDFTISALGTDLRNDHPVGVGFPLTIDFRQPTAGRPGLRWFDTDGDGRPDGPEVRVYESTEGLRVECGSCHDPHGVPSAGPGSTFLRAFLRVSNQASGLCLTCHAK